MEYNSFDPTWLFTKGIVGKLFIAIIPSNTLCTTKQYKAILEEGNIEKRRDKGKRVKGYNIHNNDIMGYEKSMQLILNLRFLYYCPLQDVVLLMGDLLTIRVFPSTPPWSKVLNTHSTILRKIELYWHMLING